MRNSAQVKQRVELFCPRLKIPEKVWKKLRAYIDACPVEVGGLGTVELIDGDLVVTDVFLLEQEVDFARTDLDPEAVAGFVTAWIRQGRDHNLLRFWWHSHGDMGVGWSDTDHATIDRLAAGTYLVSYVGNRRGEALVRLSMRHPVNLAVDDYPLVVVPEIEDALRDEVRQEVARKVRRRSVFKRFFDEPEPPRPAVGEPLSAELGSGADRFSGFFGRGGKP